MIPVHLPVMLDEVLHHLAPNAPDSLIVDGTLGEGGHSLRFLERFPDCRVLGIDADSTMRERASQRLAAYQDRFEVVSGWSDEIFASWNREQPQRILMDLGISVFHYEGSGRGFSFRIDEPLDMRLNPESGSSAADLVNQLREEDLANLIYEYGEERFSRRIAKRIVEQRRSEAFTGTLRLAEVVAKAMPPNARHGKIHAATKTFQALRIAVNDELDRLDHVLEVAPSLLPPGGRLGIISFHSLEDRRVKLAFRGLADKDDGKYRLLSRKPFMPGDSETRENPPSRSAKFRVIERLPAGAVQ